MINKHSTVVPSLSCVNFHCEVLSILSLYKVDGVRHRESNSIYPIVAELLGKASHWKFVIVNETY